MRIADGVFTGQVALFESLDDRSRVRLLLNFMGRDVNLVLPCDAVEIV